MDDITKELLRESRRAKRRRKTWLLSCLCCEGRDDREKQAALDELKAAPTPAGRTEGE